jgi:hypothetical protein
MGMYIRHDALLFKYAIVAVHCSLAFLQRTVFFYAFQEDIE